MYVLLIEPYLHVCIPDNNISNTDFFKELLINLVSKLLPIYAQIKVYGIYHCGCLVKIVVWLKTDVIYTWLIRSLDNQYINMS